MERDRRTAEEDLNIERDGYKGRANRISRRLSMSCLLPEWVVFAQVWSAVRKRTRDFTLLARPTSTGDRFLVEHLAVGKRANPLADRDVRQTVG